MGSRLKTYSTATTGSEVRIYADTSALLRRAVEEAESDALEATLVDHFDEEDSVVTSSLTWVEVSRSLRRQWNDDAAVTDAMLTEAIEVALSGVATRTIDDETISLARRAAPPALHSLDALHLATAILLDVDLALVYDQRLTDAFRSNGITTAAPGR